MTTLTDTFVFDEYLWLVVVGAIAGFWCGWGNGANDVANSFATSVGSKTLTMRQAVLIAVVFDFLGCLVLGRVTQGVIQGDIASTSTFAREPEVFAYGMMIVMFNSAIWQGIGCYYGWNVSGGHSIVGGIIGFSLVYGGSEAVNWSTPKPANFPPYTGIVPIVLTWLCAPLLGAIASGLLFALLRTLVLRRKNAYDLAFWVLPPMVFLTAWVDIYFIFTKGAKKSFAPEDDWSDEKAGWVAVCCASSLAVVSAVVVLPILRSRARTHFETLAIELADAEAKGAEMEKPGFEAEQLQPEEAEAVTFKDKAMQLLKKAKKIALQGVDVDIFAHIETDKQLKEMHDSAEVFDVRAEYVFAYLQVFSAICVVIAHGAGEVGYTSGPLGSIWSVYTTGALPGKNNPPIWVILIGAFGIIIGNATYGHHVIRSMGTKLSKLTPTRGFCAELCTAMISMIGTQFGLPMSGSQIIVGCIVGVGVVEGVKGVNWKMFGQQAFAWIATLFFMGIVTAAVFSWGVYSPGRQSLRQVKVYEDQIALRVTDMIKQYNASLYAASGFNYGTYTSTFTKQLGYTSDNIKKLTGSTIQTVEAGNVISYLDAVLKLYQDNLAFQTTTEQTCGATQLAAGKCTQTPTTAPTVKLTSKSVSLSTAKI